MRRTKTFRLGILLVLLVGGLATGLLLWRALNPIVDHTPIPAATLAAYRPGSPIEDASQAFIAARFYLGTTRLHAVGDILPYDAQVMRYAEAKAYTIPPGATDYTTYRENTRVWLVLFESEWQIQPPVPEPTSAPFQPGCVYVILSAQDGSGLGAGGVRECAAYPARTVQQIIKEFLQAIGLLVQPGTEAYPLPYLSASPSAYPTPITVFPVPPTPYPEPQASTATPAVIEPIATVESMPPMPIWYSPVITATLPISPVYSIENGEWLSATRLQLVTQGLGAGSAGLFWVELDAASEPGITSFPASLTSQAYSASAQYSVQCSSPLQMVDVVNGELISQAELTLNMHASTSCSSYVSWAGDQAAAFFAGGDGHWHAYLWRPDGSAPFRVGAAVMQTKAPAWSPDLQRLAFLSLPEDASAGLALAVVDPQGGLVETILVEGSAAGAEIRWLAPQVAAIYSGEYSTKPAWRFYTVPGGELLLTWTPGPRIVVDYYHQMPMLSPDRRWFLWEANARDASRAWHLSYRLYDVHNRQEIQLYDRPWHGLRFSGWSPDGEALYLLHLQTGWDAAADPELPYGLLAYHLNSGRYQLLVEDAQTVFWDEGSDKGLVYVFHQEGESQGTLTAGIWDPQREQVLGAFPIKDAPTRVHLFLEQSMFRSYTPAAWSPDGQQVAFFTWNGDLVLMSLDGNAQRLASRIGLRRSDFTRLLAWAPDGRRLFVSDRGKAWVVTIQE